MKLILYFLCFWFSFRGEYWNLDTAQHIRLGGSIIRIEWYNRSLLLVEGDVNYEKNHKIIENYLKDRTEESQGSKS
jgi:hypothetical protein